MLCKITSKNQITLPKELLSKVRHGEYLDARLENGCIVLEPVIVRPVEGPRLAGIRRKIAEKGLREEDVSLMVAEARDADRL